MSSFYPRVLIQNKQRDLDLSFQKKYIRQIVSFILMKEEATCDELSISFVSPSMIRRHHLRFFNDSTLTDCITLAIDQTKTDDYQVLGQIIICPKAAQNHVAIHGGNPYTETTLYLVHSLLHLLGYNDDKTHVRKKMHARQKKLMEAIAENNLLLKGRNR